MLSFILSIVFLIAAVILFFLNKKVQSNKDDYRDSIPVVSKILFLASLVLTFIFFVLSFVVVIQPGEVGVQVLFGDVYEEPLEEGIHMVNPLLSVKDISIKTESYTMSKIVEEGEVDNRPDAIEAISMDNLSMKADITVLYRLIPSQVPQIYRKIGFDYKDKVIRPAIKSSIMNVFAIYKASEIMSSKRQNVESDIKIFLRDWLEGYFKEKNMKNSIICEGILLRDVDPPAQLKKAIEEKLGAEQEAQKMEFKLQKEKKEAERKVIEAQGIADAQTVINKTLSKEYLQWYYIEMMSKIVSAPNHSTVLMPYDNKFIPLIDAK